MSEPVTVVGGGLAGSEAAYQLARRGVAVELWEMRPRRPTEAHQTGELAELVCSNSLRDDTLGTAVGVLKAEMRAMDSLIVRVAERVRVPAGTSLAVDRVRFSRTVSEEIGQLAGVTLRREELTEIPTEGITIIATGPLTSPRLSESLARLLGARHLYFYDAISPIIATDSIDLEVAYRASRYGKGGDDYINCPLDELQYNRLVDEILAAEKMPPRSFERCVYFEGCMPVEELVRRGRETLRFGPMKPVGLPDPRSGRLPHAVVQLRQDDEGGALFSMVGFQTKMRYPEQRRVFRLIPGLDRAEFVRLGSLHRNTYINTPRTLSRMLTAHCRPSLFLAGQLVGVEGYVESAATGLLCGINAAALVSGRRLVAPPPTTALGSLLSYVTERRRKSFQPMNANFGLFPSLPRRLHGREKKRAIARRALAELAAWMIEAGVGNPEQLSESLSR